ncbi:MAG: hypothetical protein DLM68_07850 [Hyphomicrobiales bacterium]|nr:MAG: hypothetical protein DLM68_07850 [Hyphomicrobiales bacterium]
MSDLTSANMSNLMPAPTSSLTHAPMRVTTTSVTMDITMAGSMAGMSGVVTGGKVSKLLAASERRLPKVGAAEPESRSIRARSTPRSTIASSAIH